MSFKSIIYQIDLRWFLIIFVWHIELLMFKRRAFIRVFFFFFLVFCIYIAEILVNFSLHFIDIGKYFSISKEVRYLNFTFFILFMWIFWALQIHISHNHWIIFRWIFINIMLSHIILFETVVFNLQWKLCIILCHYNA